MLNNIKFILCVLILQLANLKAISKEKAKIIFYELPSSNGVNSNLQDKYNYILENINKKVFNKFIIEIRQCYINTSTPIKINFESDGREIIHKIIKIDPCKDPSNFINSELSKLNNLSLIKFQYDFAIPKMINSSIDIDEAYEGNLKLIIDSLFKEKNTGDICFLIGNSFKPIKNKITFSKYEYQLDKGSLIKLAPTPSSDKVSKYIWYPDNNITIYPNYAEVISQDYEQVLKVYYLDDNNCFSDTVELTIKPNEKLFKKTGEPVYTASNDLKFLFNDLIYSKTYQKNENDQLNGEWCIKATGSASGEYVLYTTPFIADKYKIVINKYVDTKNFKGYKNYTEVIYDKIDVEADDNGNLQFTIPIKEEFKSVMDVEVIIFSSSDNNFYEEKDSKRIILKHCD